MFLSFVIPIYNDEKYLAECLDSCLDQELSKDDYEIICVDDGSEDRTPEILKDYAARYPNIRLIFKLHGHEYGYGRNIGFEAAQGEFIWFVDHDDVVAANAVDDLKKYAEAHPDYDRFAFPFYRFNIRFTEEERLMIREGTLPGGGRSVQKNHYLWSSIIRRSFMAEHGILPRSNHIDEAGAFWGIEGFSAWGHDMVAMNECYENHIRTLDFTDRPLYYYRYHIGQQVSNPDPEAVERRSILRRNKILLLGHRAYLQKQRWLRLADTDPKASQEALADAIMRLRQITVHSSDVVDEWAWKDVMKRFKEKDVFFRKKPKAYTFSLRSFLKNTPIPERFRLSTVLLYYSYTYTAANLFYQLKHHKKKAAVARRVKKLKRAEKDENYRKMLEERRDKKLEKAAKKESRKRKREAQ